MGDGDKNWIWKLVAVLIIGFVIISQDVRWSELVRGGRDMVKEMRK